MEDTWYVVKRNVAICPKCNGGCALWKCVSLEPTVYWLICDYCDYEKMVNMNEKDNKDGTK